MQLQWEGSMAVDRQDRQVKERRTVRRVVPAPTPADLVKAREERLHQVLLDNSREIADLLVRWYGGRELSIEVKVKTDFDGLHLAAYYERAGWEGCFYRPDTQSIVFPVFPASALEAEEKKQGKNSP